jgi:hypothetical protein
VSDTAISTSAVPSLPFRTRAFVGLERRRVDGRGGESDRTLADVNFFVLGDPEEFASATIDPLRDAEVRDEPTDV